MNPPILWVLALVTTGSLLTGTTALRANPRRLANRQLFVLSVHLSLWALSVFQIVAAFDAATADRWIRIASIVVAYVPTSFTLMRLSITEKDRPWSELYRRAKWHLLLDTVVALMCLTPFFLRNVHKPTVGSIPDAQYGPGYVIFVGFFVISCIVSGWRFYRAYERAREIERAELQYVLLGFAVSFAIGVGAAFLLPALTGTTAWARFGPLGVLALDGIIAYGVVRHEMQNVDIAVRRFLAKSISASLYALTFAALYLPVRILYRQVGLMSELWPALTIALVMAYGPHWLRQVHDTIDALVGETEDERRIRRLADEASRFLAQLAAPAVLTARFADVIESITHASYLAVWTLAGDRNELLQERGERPAHVGDETPSRLRAWGVGAMTDYGLERSGHFEAATTVRRLGLRMVFYWPSAHDRGVVILVGPRQGGGIYGAAHEEALDLLGRQFAFAIENARLYTEIDDARRYTETLLHNVADGVIACDAAGRLTAMNREASRLLRAGAAAPATLDDLPGTLRDALRHALAGESTPGEIELRLDHDPEPNIVRLTASPLLRADGTRIGAIATLHDVTAQRRFEERARRADRLASVGTLAASMAHEIKNPLVTIKTFIQLLPRAFDDPDLRASACPLMAAEVERIDSVVNRLLDFARPVHPALEPIHLHEVLTRTLRLIDPRRRARNIRIATDLQAADDRILGDRSLLEQVFVNLCFNAIEAMPDGGTLTLSSALVQVDSGQRDLWGQRIRVPRLRVSVADTGTGIPPDVLPRIFDPFFTTKPDGSGLGLTIAHGILHEHHASMDIESQPGAGTVVHVLFQPMPPPAQDGPTA